LRMNYLVLALFFCSGRHCRDYHSLASGEWELSCEDNACNFTIFTFFVYAVRDFSEAVGIVLKFQIEM
jgi:hypothetical protein